MTEPLILLETAARDPHGRAAWDDLYQAVCHQGVCYSDGLPLLPELARVAAGYRPGDREEVLSLAASITVDLDEEARDQYAVVVGDLRSLAEQTLAEPGGDRRTRIQVLLAFEGDTTWGRALADLDPEELEVECPGCDDSLFVVFGPAGHFTTAYDYATEDPVDATPLRPAAELTGLGRRLHAELGDSITYVFGIATCPNCGTEFTPADRLN